MTLQLDEEDVRTWCEAVQRYGRQHLAPLAARPECVPALADCRRAIAGLQELGVLGGGASHHDGQGWGLWQSPEVAQARALNLRHLRCVAGHTPALALQMHLQALALHLDRLAEIPKGEGHAMVVLSGAHGLGRQALARLLAGASIEPDDAHVLSDNWGRPHAQAPRLLSALQDWSALWWCSWGQEGWVWHRSLRADLLLRAHSVGTLGLDELSTWSIHGTQRAAPVQLTGDRAEVAWWRLQAVHGMALLAICQSVAEQAHARALVYARQRHQGGRCIVEHAAVQQLLVRAQSAAREVDSALDKLSLPGEPWDDLRELWRLRARCHPRLSDGVSAALQVFGGLGYMRDTGMEKSLRLSLHLRLLAGSPAELERCVAAWDVLTAPGTQQAGRARLGQGSDAPRVVADQAKSIPQVGFARDPISASGDRCEGAADLLSRSTP